ncbi:PAS domain S-box protein [Pseudanabaena sp. PCC 6802]|uniref:PAS domain S-box protein n=1 Tax=Pseudanabaena sp. PCC 6802 TaxID=118173 RepID=UPI00034ADBB7|nr:PAS domain S-box protein [Pseudanabaena sp. PCC 6802]
MQKIHQPGLTPPLEKLNHALTGGAAKVIPEHPPDASSKKFYTALADVMPVGVFYTDASCNCQYINQRLSQMIGMTLEAAMGGGWLKGLYPEDRDRVAHEWLHAIDREIPFESEFRLQRQDGSITWVFGQAIAEGSGKDKIYIGTVTDISNHKSIEQALQQSETNFRAIFEKAAVGFSYSDLEGKIFLVNQKYADTLGYTTAELTSMRLQDITYPPDRNNDDSYFRQLLAGKIANYSIEKRFLRRDGSHIWVNLTMAPIQIDSSGTQYFISSIQDISDRKRADDAMRQQFEREQLVGAITRRVRKSLELEQILATTVEQARQVLQADRVLVCKIARSGTGLVVAESVSNPWNSLLNTYFSAEAIPPECLQSYLEGHITYITDRKSDPILPCMSELMAKLQVEAILAVPIIQENESLWGLLIAHQCSRSRDWQAWEVTLQLQLADQLAIATKQSELYQQLQLELNERKRAEEQLRQTNDRLAVTNIELARATRLKDEFLANMSHELRTPLNAILGMSEGLLEEGYAPLVEKQKKAINTIAKSGNHLLELINDILDLAKIEAGKLDLQIASVRLERLCDTSMTFIKQQAQKKNITLTTKISGDSEPVFMDERRMRQVLINLLSNAVKFTNEGGSVTLEVSLDKAKREINFNVIDTGIGIASKDIKKLFEAFVQIDSSLSRRHDGTGLGLALVRRIVEMHGGKVSVESEVGQGSKFQVNIPWWQSSQMKLDLLASEHHRYHHYKVAMIGDSEQELDALSWHLADMGIRSVSYCDMGKAWHGLLQLDVDLVVMNIRSLSQNHLKMLSHIQSNPHTNYIPLLIISSIEEQKQLAALLQFHPSVEYLARPFLEWQVCEAVNRIKNAERSVHLAPKHNHPCLSVLIAQESDTNVAAIANHLQAFDDRYQIVQARTGQRAIELARCLNPPLILLDMQIPEMDGLAVISHLREIPELDTARIIAISSINARGDRERCLRSGANEYFTKPVMLKSLLSVMGRLLHTPHSS